jgi:hypothetical protein
LTLTLSFSPSPTLSPPNTATVSPTITETFTASPTPLPPPEKFRIVSVYPNPVSAKGGKIVVSLPAPAVLLYRINDLRGELIWEDVERYPLGGNYELLWPAVNNSGSAVSYGAYYLSVKAKMAGGDALDGKWISVVR